MNKITKNRVLISSIVVVALSLPSIVTPFTGIEAKEEALDERPDWRSYILGPESRDVYPKAIEYIKANGGIIENPENLFEKDGEVAHIEHKPNSDPILVIDFGINLCGYLEAGITSDSSPVVGFGFSESLAYLSKSGDNEQASWCSGPGVWADPNSRAFRYVMVYLLSDGWVDIDYIKCNFLPPVYTAKDYKGYFLCNDDLLNRIWYAGVYTNQMCTVESKNIFIDGAKRDRMVWNGDFGVQGPIAYYSLGNTETLKNSLKVAADEQRWDGYMPAMGLADVTKTIALPYSMLAPLLPSLMPVFTEIESPVIEILQGPINRLVREILLLFTEYVCWWTIGFYEYYMLSGDKTFIDDYYTNMKSAMNWLALRPSRDGLIISIPPLEIWNWHPFDLTVGRGTELNVMYYKALLDGAEIAKLEGNGGLAVKYLEKAEKIKKSINSLLWNSEKGAYCSSDLFSNAIPQDANVLAVLFGIADAERSASILRYIRENMWTDYGSMTTDTSSGTGAIAMQQYISPFMSYYELEARFGMNEDLNALDLIRRCWGYMVDADPASTMWEKMAIDGTPAAYKIPGIGIDLFSPGSTSLCHGWGAGPTATLSSRVLGVELETPGFEKFSIMPHPGDLEWAEGVVPTAYGDILVSWNNENGFKMEVEVPEGTSCTIGMPKMGEDPVITINGSIVAPSWQDGHYLYFEGMGPGNYELVAQ